MPVVDEKVGLPECRDNVRGKLPRGRSTGEQLEEELVGRVDLVPELFGCERRDLLAVELFDPMDEGKRVAQREDGGSQLGAHSDRLGEPPRLPRWIAGGIGKDREKHVSR